MTQTDTHTARCNMDDAAAWPDARDSDRAFEAANCLVEAIFDMLAEARDRAQQGVN